MVEREKPVIPASLSMIELDETKQADTSMHVTVRKAMDFLPSKDIVYPTMDMVRSWDEIKNFTEKHDPPIRSKVTLNGMKRKGMTSIRRKISRQQTEEHSVVSVANMMHFQQIFVHPESLQQYKNVGGWRRRMRNFLEDPTSSKKAKSFSLVSTAFIVISMIGMILASMNTFQTVNGEPHLLLQMVEIGCISWFTLEYVIRLLIFPRKLEFLINPMNIIDLLSIAPFYLELSLQAAGLRATIKASSSQFRMLALYIGTVVLLFSTVVYYLENDEPDTKFTSIPTSFWWCIVTMTTVGYGDMIPTTVVGQIVASIATLSGVIVLAFPITVIVTNFGKVYERSVQQKKQQNPDDQDEMLSADYGRPIVKSVGIV